MGFCPAHSLMSEHGVEEDICTCLLFYIGQYTCVAENEAGTARVSADIEVQNGIGSAPQLIIEPYDIDALPGSTIEMPCQSDGDPQPEV